MDLCAGPHLPSTGRIKAVKLMSTAPNAVPMMFDSELMIWLTPATRVSWASGASSGTEACIEGVWKAEPTERQASRR